MKNLFLVSVAIGIFSGTTLPVKAQPAVNVEQLNAATAEKKSVKFIEGIEIKPLTTVTEKQVNTNIVNPRLAVVKPTTINEFSTIESFTSLQFKYALLLDMEIESITNTILFNEIEKWWGTRYKYGGATQQGIDCSAYAGTLIHNVYGLVLPRTSREQYDDCFKLEKAELQQGDLVFFKTGRGVSHVGLYLGNGYFTHASTSIGVTINNLAEAYWNSRFISGGRINTCTPE